MSRTLGKLKESFPSKTNIEIIQGIAEGKISGMWIADYNKEECRRKVDGITEEEAEKLVQSIDKDRESSFGMWELHN